MKEAAVDAVGPIVQLALVSTKGSLLYGANVRACRLQTAVLKLSMDMFDVTVAFSQNFIKSRRLLKHVKRQ